MEERMKKKLARRERNQSLRKPLSRNDLSTPSRYDFSSNDYLGLAQSLACTTSSSGGVGATGSRLLSGDSLYCRDLEEWLATLHSQDTATIFNSGYDANLSILSSTLEPGDLVLMDELCHNSLVMGVRMSRLGTEGGTSGSSADGNHGVQLFAHNSVQDLKRLLIQYRGQHSSSGCCLIVVESIYSMDGDVGPLSQILDLAREYGAQVVVDEAHGLGVYGKSNRHDLPGDNSGSLAHACEGGTGVLAAMGLEHHPALLCGIFTFGKAAGCHGAVVCGSTTLRDYIWNYARPFIYSTALPQHSLMTIRASYEVMVGSNGEKRRHDLFQHVKLFRNLLADALEGAVTINESINVSLWPSASPIQALMVPGNELCKRVCQSIWNNHSIRLYPIRAPTVPLGQERVRIVLHSHNTNSQVRELVSILFRTLVDLKLVGPKRLFSARL